MALNLPSFAFAPQNHDMSNLSKMVENFYKGYESARTPVKLEQEELARALQNKILGIHNQYLPGQYESNINNTNAQTGLYGAQTKLQGQHGALYEQQALDLIRKRQIIDSILAQAGLGSGGMQQGAAGNAGAQMPQIQGNAGQATAPSQQPPMGTPQQPTMQNMGQSLPAGNNVPNPAVSQLSEAIFANLMGIDAFKPIVTPDGELVQPSYFGEPKITRISEPADVKEGKKVAAGEKAKSIQKYKDEIADKYASARAQQQTLEYIIELSESDEAKSAIGPANQFLGKYSSNEEVQQMSGILDTLNKTLATDMFKAFGSRVTDNDLRFIKSQKTDLSQPFAVNGAKAKTLLALARLAEKQEAAIYENLENGDDKLKAISKAADNVNFREEMDKIKAEAKERETKKADQLYLGQYKMADIEATAKAKNMTVEQVKKELEKRGK